MDSKGKILTNFSFRILGAIIGAVGFFLVAYQYQVIGTTLIGVGSVLIAAGES